MAYRISSDNNQPGENGLHFYTGIFKVHKYSRIHYEYIPFLA